MNDLILTDALRELRAARAEHTEALAGYRQATDRVQASTDRLTKALNDVQTLVASSDDPALVEVPS